MIKIAVVGAMVVLMMIAIGFVYTELVAVKKVQSPVALEATRLAIATRVINDQIQKRVNVLAADGCQSKAIELSNLDAKTPVRVASDIPILLLQDLQLCLQRGIFLSYVRDSLRDSGLLTIMTNAREKPDY